jgi:2-furoyl-CoA dehydrogenase large subunit
VLEAPNAADEINSAATYGFVFDFCGVEIDRDTGEVCVDNYVSLHDAGRILNSVLFDGQVRGAFAMAVGAALYERFVYDKGGSFLTGSFADYAVPTAGMVPGLTILHRETASPVTPLGAKGVAEGNSMSTPVCIANAVADALGVADLELPLTPPRVLALVKAAGRRPATREYRAQG